jgi:hypothetical protein
MKPDSIFGMFISGIPIIGAIRAKAVITAVPANPANTARLTVCEFIEVLLAVVSD